MIKITCRELTKAEKLYTHSQSQQIEDQTGFIGLLHLRYKHGPAAARNYTADWHYSHSSKEQGVSSEETDCVARTLKSTYTMMAWTSVRLDIDENSYLLDFSSANESEMLCYCYNKKSLDRHIQKCEMGDIKVKPANKSK